MSNEQGLSRTGSGGLQRAEDLAGALITKPQELAARIREMQQVAHVLSPAIAVSSIAPQYAVNTAVVVIDTALPKVEYGSAAGNDVYYQSSIHKGTNRKIGDEWNTEILEVSLNKNGLIKILGAAGVDMTRSERTDDRKDPYYWAWASEGEIVDFDGRRRRLPPGNVEIDYRDGSAQIGEWTPAEWAKRAAAAEEKRRGKSERDAKAIKPEPINGWSEDRVRNARRFGSRIAEAESLNRLIRNLGVKQKYTLEELKKPFVIFRCSFMPDMSDPATLQIVTAAHMGASHLLYGQRGAAAPAGDIIDVHSSSPEPSAAAPAEGSSSAVSASTASAAPSMPAGAVELDDIPEPAPPKPAAKTYAVTRASQLEVDGQSHYFFETKEGVTFVTEDRTAAMALMAAKKAGTAVPIEGEAIVINGTTYQHVLDCPPAQRGSMLPDPKTL